MFNNNKHLRTFDVKTNTRHHSTFLNDKTQLTKSDLWANGNCYKGAWEITDFTKRERRE